MICIIHPDEHGYPTRDEQKRAQPGRSPSTYFSAGGRVVTAISRRPARNHLKQPVNGLYYLFDFTTF
jgi:hypothetical protein